MIARRWLLAAVVLLGCAPSPPEDEAALEVRVVDYPDGRSEQRLRPRRRAGLERDDVALARQALVGRGPLPARRLAFVLVDLGDGVNISPERARAAAFGMAPGDQSMKQVLLEHSFGRQDLEGEVFGPLRGSMIGCDEDALADSLRAQVPAGFDNYVWYLGNKVSACGWAGVASLGQPGHIGGELWVNGTAACKVATHEFGHNLGLQHASRLRCGTSVFADNPLISCTDNEYGDETDMMGDGCNHVNGYSKSYLGWMEGCNGVRVQETGFYTLFPVERACNGVQVLQVPMRKERRFEDTTLRYYFIELRAPIGLDAKVAPQLQLRVGSDVVTTTGGKRTFILDFNPQTPLVDGLGNGQMFQDPAGGVRLQVVALDAGSATVRVELDPVVTAMLPPGPSTCLDGSVFQAPGPAVCGNETARTPEPGAGEVTPPVPEPVRGPRRRAADAGACALGGKDAGGGGGGGGGAVMLLVVAALVSRARAGRRQPSVK